MSFVSKSIGNKRLARRTAPADDDNDQETNVGTDLYIIPYTERSIVVMGDTLNHSNALVTLGGKYNTNLRIGQGWIFAKVREDSVRQYIETGEIHPYVYSREDQAKFEKKPNNEAARESGVSEQQLRKLFREFRDAFDVDEEYEGSSIIDVIYQLEEHHLSKTAIKKTAESPKRQPNKRLARKIEPDDEEAEMESEDDDDYEEEEEEDDDDEDDEDDEEEEEEDEDDDEE